MWLMQERGVVVHHVHLVHLVHLVHHVHLVPVHPVHLIHIIGEKKYVVSARERCGGASAADANVPNLLPNEKSDGSISQGWIGNISDLGHFSSGFCTSSPPL